MCFTLSWFLHFLVALVVICGVVALLQLVISFVLPKLKVGAEVLAFIVQAFTIIFWVVVCCALIVFVGELIACLLGMLGGFSLFPLR